MENAARRFALWVLGIHLMVFAILVVIVIFASTEVYSSARRQALDQVRVRQEMLAAQAARGISTFYRSILDELELLKLAEFGGASDPATAPATPAAQRVDPRILAPLVWERLRGRAVRMFEVEGRFAGRVVAEFGDDDRTSAADIIQKARIELFGVTQPTVTDSYNFNGTQAALLVMPIGDTERRLLVAVVPTRAIETRFLNDLNEPENIGSLVLNGREVVRHGIGI
jgi:hypothetical protein